MYCIAFLPEFASSNGDTRIHTLAAPVFLRILPDSEHLRGYARRLAVFEHRKPWLQRELRSSALNCGAGWAQCSITQWLASPACTELEALVMDWAAKMFGLQSVFWNANEVGGGVMQVRSYLLLRFQAQSLPAAPHGQTTASDSTLTAIVAARAWYLSEHPGTSLESLVIYVTSQTHSSGLKAGMILGLRVRALDVDVAVVADNTGLTGEGLITAVKEDHARGLHPFVFSEYFSARIFRRFAETSYSCYGWNDIVRRH